MAGETQLWFKGWNYESFERNEEVRETKRQKNELSAFQISYEVGYVKFNNMKISKSFILIIFWIEFNYGF